MDEFIKYLRMEKIFEKLFKIYEKNFRTNTHKDLLEKINKRIENLRSFKENFSVSYESSQPSSDFDIIGNLYEDLVNHKDRKILGEFYTPQPVVKDILIAIKYIYQNNIENKKIIDISCGSGSFLIHIIKILIERFLKIFQKNNLFELSVLEAKTIINVIKNNISGVDINPIACILCQINIHFILFKILNVIKNSEPNFNLPQFNIRNENALLLDEKEKYDYVIGNPPYLFIRDIPIEQKRIIEKGNFVTNENQYDYYQLFIEIGIRLLKINGKLGYILPDSILALSSRRIIRKFIYDRTKIIEIYYIGPKFEDPIVSNIILVLQKEKNIITREKNYIRIKLGNKKIKQIPQNILKSWDYNFLIHLNEKDFSIIEYLNNNFLKLKDLNQKKGFEISISRGTELAKTGNIIYCERCKSYFPVPKKHLVCPNCDFKLKPENIEQIIYDKIPNNKIEDFKPFIYSIGRYNIKNYKFIDTTKNGINYKDLDIYNNRIIIRQLNQNNLICATIDEKLSLTSQSFYNIKINKTPLFEFNNYYLLGLVNSRLLSYYIFNLFSSYKRIFPRILIEKIKILPIKIPETENEKQLARKIIDAAKKLLRKYDETIEKKIDTFVFDLFKIPEEHRNYIMNFAKINI
ncbi:MAG: Eco57I restriction-modification methylase domain-containing protein [Promethearchaeota archaeon]